jgi:hypothetical protein
LQGHFNIEEPGPVKARSPGGTYHPGEGFELGTLAGGLLYMGCPLEFPGSPLSTILFLLFASELLKMFDSNSSSIVDLGFADDTNLLVWGPTAAGNCRQLEAAHERCLSWARRHGGKFALDKYKLIHFTRRHNADIQAAAQIEGFDGKLVDSLRVLGVSVDLGYAGLRGDNFTCEATESKLCPTADEESMDEPNDPLREPLLPKDP